MGLTKTENFTKEELELAKMFKVLGHPARIAILNSIIKANACVCGDMVSELGLAQSTVSQHLKELKSVGLIKGSIEGASMCYCVDIQRLNNLKNEIVDMFNSANCEDDCC